MICEDGLEWKYRVCMHGCVMKGVSECEGMLQGHHVITQNKMKKNGLEAHLKDTDAGVGCCERHHRRHHNRREPILKDRLPAAALAFAGTHGLEWMIDRYYSMEVLG